MNDFIIRSTIEMVLTDLDKIKEGINCLKMTDKDVYLENYESISKNTALLSEKLACKMRKLVYISTDVKPTDYLDEVSNELEIGITFENEVYEICVPALLPKKTKQNSSEFLIVPLAYNIEKFNLKNRDVTIFKECVICFNQVYSRDSSSKRIRDYDNIDLKRILDLLSIYFLIDDSGQYIDVFNTTSLGEKDCTKISIMSKEKFKNWV